MIFEERRAKQIIDDNAMRARDRYEEHRTSGIVGEVIDTFIYPDGRRELVRPMDHNLVVNTCSTLIACLMKGEIGYAGATYWAVGAGSDTWSDVVPPAPLAGDTQLTAETYRKAIDPLDIVFLDSSNVVSLVPTSKIQITTTFLETEANGPLREFGIFGGLAGSTTNSGLMINHKIHPMIYKTVALQLERILRIQF